MSWLIESFDDFLNKKYTDIFVDFDQTLYLWDESQLKKDSLAEFYAKSIAMRDGSQYNPDQINKILIKYLQESNAKVHLATHVRISANAEAKFNFINKYYPNLLTDWFGLANPESKILLLDAFVCNGYDKSEILMIDDNDTVIDCCKCGGFDVQNPQFIMGLYTD